jgi:hypothetical protein
MNNTESTFQAGTVYTTGEARDYVWRFEVVKRTARFVTLRDVLTGELSRAGVRVVFGREVAYPLGTYSMAPCLSADRPL